MIRRNSWLICLAWAAVLAAIKAVTAVGGAEQSPRDHVVTIASRAPIERDSAIAEGEEFNGWKRYKGGQEIQATVTLPEAPANQREARRIVAKLVVEPVIRREGDILRPADPWTRLGSVSIVRGLTPTKTDQSPPEIELMRFVTGFGGPGTFEQDVTAMAPLLAGQTTFRIFISTYKKPAWTVTLSLDYLAGDAGYRRPVYAQPLFNNPSVIAGQNKLQATIEVPSGLARPRIHVLSTGHATDGTGGDEFISRAHILRVDGNEVARWKPWAEDVTSLRSLNPMSGRDIIDGRELWSCDLDRSGWRPNEIVVPLRIPVPELSPGKHLVELEIVGIRPKDASGNFGYWRTSAVVVADEPWPAPATNEKEE
jgi:hypothetical protein